MNPAVLKWIRTESWPRGSFELPQWQAHRGYWVGGFPENTLASFRAARVAGFSICELDVRLTKDGVPVVFHDENLERFGAPAMKVKDLTAAELASRAQAPLLRDVLSDAAVPEFFNVELKVPLGELGRIEPAVTKVIQELRAEKRILFSSFNPLSLVLLAKLLPEVPRALLATAAREQGNHFIFRNLLFAPLLKLHLLHLDRRMLNRKTCEDLCRAGIPFSVWTVNDPKEAKLFLEWGARSIITDQLIP